MARDGYRIFDFDTHVGPDAAILSTYLSAAEKDRLAGWAEYEFARPPRQDHLHQGSAPLSPPPRRRRTRYSAGRVYGRVYRGGAYARALAAG